MVRFTSILALLFAACAGGGGGGGTPASQLVRAAIVSADDIAGMDVATFPDGSTVVIGEVGGTLTLGAGEPNEATVPGPDAWSLFVARYGPDGTLLWVRTVATKGANGVACIALPDGSSIVTGDMSGVVVFGSGEPNETVIDAGTRGWSFVARYEADGALAWVKPIPGGAIDGIAGFSDSTFVVCGDFSDAVFAVGEANETAVSAESRSDLFLAKYAASGALLWLRTAGMVEDSAVRAFAVAAFPGGECVVTGYLWKKCIFGRGEPNETTLETSAVLGVFPVNPYVARYRADGTLAWARKADCDDSVSPFAVAALPDGSSAITGRLVGAPIVFGSGEPHETTLVGPGLYVARYGPAGDLAWAKGVESPTEFDQHGGIDALPDGSVVVTGGFYTEALAGVGEPNQTLLAAEHGAFLARYRIDGSIEWAGRDAGASSSEGKAVAAVGAGSFVWVGAFDRDEGLVLEDGTAFPPGDGQGLWIAHYRG